MLGFPFKGVWGTLGFLHAFDFFLSCICHVSLLNDGESMWFAVVLALQLDCSLSVSEGHTWSCVPCCPDPCFPVMFTTGHPRLHFCVTKTDFLHWCLWYTWQCSTYSVLMWGSIEGRRGGQEADWNDRSQSTLAPVHLLISFSLSLLPSVARASAAHFAYALIYKLEFGNTILGFRLYTTFHLHNAFS